MKNLEELRMSHNELSIFFILLMEKNTSIADEKCLNDNEELLYWIKFIRNQFIHGIADTSTLFKEKCYRFDFIDNLLYFDFDTKFSTNAQKEVEKLYNNKYYKENLKSIKHKLLEVDYLDYQNKLKRQLIVCLDLEIFNNLLNKNIEEYEVFFKTNELIMTKVPEIASINEICENIDFLGENSKIDCNELYYLKFTLINLNIILKDGSDDYYKFLAIISSTSWLMYDFIYREDSGLRSELYTSQLDSKRKAKYKEIRNCFFHYKQESITKAKLIDNALIINSEKYSLTQILTEITLEISELTKVIDCKVEEVRDECRTVDRRREEILPYKIKNIFTKDVIGDNLLSYADLEYISSDKQLQYDILSFIHFFRSDNNIESLIEFYKWLKCKSDELESYDLFTNWWYCTYIHYDEMEDLIESIRYFESNLFKVQERIEYIANHSTEDYNVYASIRTDFYKNTFFGKYVFYEHIRSS